MFQYSAFGLNIQSGVSYPEFLPVYFSGKPDVYLEHLEMIQCDEKYTGVVDEPAKNTSMFFQFTIKGVATYHVINGCQIQVRVFPDAEPSSVRLYCLSNAFAALLFQQGKIPLHAAAIKNSGKLALLLGDSGAGKSTLMLYMKSLGYAVFSDDVCVPFRDQADGMVKVYASYPMIKSWASTIAMLDLQMDSFHLLKSGMEKYGSYFHDDFDFEARMPEYLFFLTVDNTAEQVGCDPVFGVDIFTRLTAQIYRSHHLREAWHGQLCFDIFSRMSQQVKAFVITRPHGIDSLSEIGEKIIDQIMH